MTDHVSDDTRSGDFRQVDDDITIERRRPNETFTIIGNELLQDPDMSADAQMVATYLLSLPKDWVIRPRHIWKSKNIGRDRVYKAINELIELGYMEMVEIKNPKHPNLKGKQKYILNGFKKCFRRPEIQDPEIRDPEIQDYTKDIYSTKKTDIESEPSASLRLAEFLFESIKSRDKKAKPPPWKRWETDMRRLVDIDGRSDADVRQVIEWVQTHEFWSTTILSPANLRKHFSKLWLQMQRENANKAPSQAKQEESDKRYQVSKENKAWALKKASGYKNVKCKECHVEYRMGGHFGILAYHEYGFKDQLKNLLQKLE